MRPVPIMTNMVPYEPGLYFWLGECNHSSLSSCRDGMNVFVVVANVCI